MSRCRSSIPDVNPYESVKQRERRTMELLTRCWTRFRQRWPIVFACLAVAVLGVTVYHVSADRNYVATTELFLRAPDVKTSVGAYQGDLFSRQRAQTYVKMFHSEELAQMVVDKLGLNITAQELASKVSATPVKSTVLIDVSITDSNAQHAANIANGYGDVLATYIAKIENVAGDPRVGPLVRVVTRADPASAKVSGLPTSMVAFAALTMALLVAASFIWFLERFDDKVRSRRQVEEITGCDIVGKLPKTRALGSNGDVGQAFDESEEFKQAALRLSLNVESVLQRLPRIKAEIPPVVAVVAGHRGDGSTVTTRALARAFAERGRAAGVVRLDAPNRELEKAKPVVAGSALAKTGNRTDPVTTVSCSTAALATQIRSRDNLLLESNVILIDTPAFHESIDAQLALSAADAVLLVVRPIANTTLSLCRLVAAIKALDILVLGVVVNPATESSTIEGFYL
jgi:capsular polysaccharide biosynthesis protein/Mrp family chromosome partitioning ATPase